MAHGGVPTEPRPRPDRGVLARHGWLWLAGPAGTLLLVGLVLSVFAHAGTAPNPNVSALAGFALLIGGALTIVGLPVRAMVVSTRHQEWADARRLERPDDEPAEPAPTDEQLRRRDGLRRLTTIGLDVLLVAIVVVMGRSGLTQLTRGVHAQQLQQSSGTALVQATLDRDTDVHHHIRSTTYADRVSYVVAGRTEHGVAVDADRAGFAGDPIEILVDPAHPRDAIAASDEGWGDLVFGGLLLLTPVVLLLLVAWSLLKRQRRRGRRKGASTRV